MKILIGLLIVMGCFGAILGICVIIWGILFMLYNIKDAIHELLDKE